MMRAAATAIAAVVSIGIASAAIPSAYAQEVTDVILDTVDVCEQESAEHVVQAETLDDITTNSGWYTVGENKYYRDAFGINVIGWQKIDGSKYYFNADGTMATMWQTIDGNRYFFGKTGVMRTMWQTIGGKKYYFGGTGVMRTMWETIGGKKYYFGKTGVMRTMWQTIGGKKYYFGGTGVMRTLWETIGGKKYYFGKTGVMRTMWETIGGKKYYFGKTGVMRQGWETIGGNKYYFGKSGVMRTMFQEVNGKTYYFGKSGIRREGWERVDGYLYYFGKSGVMRTDNVMVNGVNCYFGETGRLQDRNGHYVLKSKANFEYRMNDGDTWTTKNAKLVKLYSYKMNGTPSKIAEYEVNYQGYKYYFYQVYSNGYYTNYPVYGWGIDYGLQMPMLVRNNGNVEIIYYHLYDESTGFMDGMRSQTILSVGVDSAGNMIYRNGNRVITESEADAILERITNLGHVSTIINDLL